jgi:hypothetical protein
MNWTTAQGMPCAMQRMIMPNPLEDLPLPAPVWTMIRPFSSVFRVFIISSAAAALMRFIFLRRGGWFVGGTVLTHPSEGP